MRKGFALAEAVIAAFIMMAIMILVVSSGDGLTWLKKTDDVLTEKAYARSYADRAASECIRNGAFDERTEETTLPSGKGATVTTSCIFKGGKIYEAKASVKTEGADVSYEKTMIVYRDTL